MNHIIAEIVETIAIFKEKGVCINFLWVRGHCGIKENEIVDTLAKEATNSGEMANYKLPHTDIKGIIAKAALQKWQTDYNNGDKGRFYKTMADQLPRQPWFKGTVTNKWVVTTISRLRANHAVCGSYLHRINKRSSPLCVDCNEEEDFNHVIMICPRYVVERKRMFDDIYRYLDAPFRYEDIIFSTNSYVLKSIAELAMKYECI
ncbi:uncharacterized protein [Rhodnius prolixus]|uniref:uncharacterized protein n=1 Tax=Rhodnius prolixus TaxID=13249 RepID=UPI003D1891B1